MYNTETVKELESYVKQCAEKYKNNLCSLKQLRAVFTTYCMYYYIEAHTIESDNLLLDIWNMIEERMLPYDSFKDFMYEDLMDKGWG